MSRSRFLVIPIAGVLILSSAFPACKRQTDPGVLARVGEKEIRLEEFQRQKEKRQGGSPIPIDSQLLLDELVSREVLVQNARKIGLENDEEVQELIRDVLIAKLKERQLGPQLQAATVSDAEVKAAYEAEHARFTTPERVRLAMLYLRPANGSGEAGAAEIRRRLESAKSQIMQVSHSSDRSFGPLAVNHSEDQETRYRGGDLGWVERERFPHRLDPKVIAAGFALREAGDVTDVIQGENGFYLVKLIERQDAAVLPLQNVEPALRSQLLREKQEQIEAGFFASLRESVPVEVHPERLPVSTADGSPATQLPPRLP